jgi:hypothetical protein
VLRTVDLLCYVLQNTIIFKLSLNRCRVLVLACCEALYGYDYVTCDRSNCFQLT